MAKTLIGSSDPDQPLPEPSLQDEHAERMTLAALLHHSALTTHLTTVLHGMDSTNAAHREIFYAATAVHRRREGCTPATAAAELAHQQQPRPDATTATEAKRLIHDLAAAAPVEAVAVYYAAIVRDLAALRRYHPSARLEGLPSVSMRGFLIDEDDS